MSNTVYQHQTILILNQEKVWTKLPQKLSFQHSHYGLYLQYAVYVTSTQWRKIFIYIIRKVVLVMFCSSRSRNCLAGLNTRHFNSISFNFNKHSISHRIIHGNHDKCFEKVWYCAHWWLFPLLKKMHAIDGAADNQSWRIASEHSGAISY